MNVHVEIELTLTSKNRTVGVFDQALNVRGATNTWGGEYDTYHEYKAMNTTIYSSMHIGKNVPTSQKFTNNNDSMVN